VFSPLLENPQSFPLARISLHSHVCHCDAFSIPSGAGQTKGSCSVVKPRLTGIFWAVDVLEASGVFMLVAAANPVAGDW